MIGIYKITNPKGKVYIGQSQEIEKRWKSYVNFNCINQVRLFRSFQKYQISNHVFEILEECKQDQLNIRERYWQDYYDVLGENGLNCKLTKTSDRSGKHSDASKQKMTRTRTGQKRGPQSPEHIAKRVAQIKGKTYEEIYGVEKAKELRENKRSRMVGLKKGPISEQHRNNISNARVGNFRQGVAHTEATIQKMRKPKKKVECLHCKQVGGNSQMTRWHFENCKQRQL